MKIRTHKDLDVYKLAFESAVLIYELTNNFPKEELYSLTDQIRRSSRSVCTNIAKAFRKRKYPNAFVAKLSDSEAEGAETQVWLDFSLKFNYIEEKVHYEIYAKYDFIIGKIVNMSLHPEQWNF